MTPQDNTPELKWSVLKVLTAKTAVTPRPPSWQCLVLFEVVCAEGINSARDIPCAVNTLCWISTHWIYSQHVYDLLVEWCSAYKKAYVVGEHYIHRRSTKIDNVCYAIVFNKNFFQRKQQRCVEKRWNIINSPAMYNRYPLSLISVGFES
jgi:hypothetical protein